MDVTLSPAIDLNQLIQLPSSMQRDVQPDQVTQGQQTTLPNGKDQPASSFFKKDKLNQLVSEANQALQPQLTEIHYVLHDKLNQYFVQVEDASTHKVIREIPPKKFLDMYAAIAEKLGLIVNHRV